MQYVYHNNSKSLNEYSASCSYMYHSPISVAHIQLEIVGDPKVRMFTIVTVIKERHAMLLPYKVKVNVNCTHKHIRKENVSTCS